MRRRLLVPLFLLAGCTAPRVNAPSLAPRATEAIDPRLPVPESALPATPNPALVEQLKILVARAEAGDAQFQPLAVTAQHAASAAGPAESESWIAAQQALSALEASREPITRAAADVDALGAQRIQQLGGIAAADLKVINAALAKVRMIDEREAILIKTLQDRLAH